MEFLGTIASFWFFGAIVSSFYFWWTKTDRSQAPIVRRFTALGYGLAWPVLLVKYFTDRQEVASQEAERREAEHRILGGGGGASTPPASSPRPTGSTIRNPFDDD
jgi:hypothetical protein